MIIEDKELHKVWDAVFRMSGARVALKRKVLVFTAFVQNLAANCEQRRSCPMGVFHSLPFNLPISSSGLLAALIQVIVTH